jgi:hypothetical protein
MEDQLPFERSDLLWPLSTVSLCFGHGCPDADTAEGTTSAHANNERRMCRI